MRCRIWPAPEYVRRDELAREDVKPTGAMQPYEKTFLHCDGRRLTALFPTTGSPPDADARAGGGRAPQGDAAFCLRTVTALRGACNNPLS